MTFAQLRQRRGVRLILTATNETRGGLQVFAPETTPGVRIWQAMLATMAIPLYYPAVEIDGELFSDGGALANHPVDLVADYHPPHEVVAFRLDSTRDQNPLPVKGRPRPFRRLLNLYRIIDAHGQERHVPKAYWPRVVKIDTGDVKATDFDLDEVAKERLYAAGEQAWVKWAANQANGAHASRTSAAQADLEGHGR